MILNMMGEVFSNELGKKYSFKGQRKGNEKFDGTALLTCIYSKILTFL